MLLLIEVPKMEVQKLCCLGLWRGRSVQIWPALHGFKIPTFITVGKVIWQAIWVSKMRHPKGHRYGAQNL